MNVTCQFPATSSTLVLLCLLNLFLLWSSTLSGEHNEVDHPEDVEEGRDRVVANVAEVGVDPGW